MSDIHFVLHAQTGNVERSIEEVDTAAIVNTATSPPMPQQQQQQRALSQGTLHRSSEAVQQDTTQPPHVVRLGPTEGTTELVVVAGDANGANAEPRRSRRHPHRHHRHRTNSSNNSNTHRAHTASPRNSRRYSVGSVNGMGPSSPLDQQPTRPSSLLQIPSVLASQMVDGTYGNTRNQPDNNNNNNDNEEEVAASAALRRRRSQDGESGARERRRRRNARPQGVRYGTSINGNGGILHGARGGAAPNTNRNARWEAQQSMMISTIARQHYDNHGRETSSVYETPRAMPLNTRGTTHRSTQQQQQPQPQQEAQNGSLHTGNHHTHGNATRIGNTSTTLPAGVNGAVNTTTTGISPHPYEMYNPQYYERLRLREEVFNRAHYVLTKPPLVIAAPLLTEGPWRQSLLRSWCGSTPEGARLCRLRHLLKNMNNTITSNSSRDEGKRSARAAQPMIAVEGGTSSHHPHTNNNSSSNDVDVVEVEDDDTRGIGRHGGSRSHSNHRRNNNNNNNYVHDPTNSLIEATALSLSLNRGVDGQRSGTITPPSMHAPADYLTSDSRRAGTTAAVGGTSSGGANCTAALHTSQIAASRIHNINSSNTNGGGGEWQLGGQTMTRTHSRASDMASEIAFYEETSALNTNNNSAARMSGVGERGVSVDHRNVPRPPSLIQHNSRSTTTGGGGMNNNINETGSPGNTSSLLISGEARTQYILDHSIGTVGNPLSSNGSMQHASRHATQEGSTETGDMIANNNNNNNNGYTSGGSNGIATTVAQGVQMHNVVRNGHTAEGGTSSSSNSNGSEPRLLRRRNTTQPGISHVQAQPVQSPTTVATDVSTAVMNSLTNRGEASYSREESDPTRANSEDTREAAISRAAMAPLTHKDRMRHFVRRWFCTRCTIAEQTELLAQEEKWRHYAPYALCCTCFFGDGSNYRHTMCAMCLCDIVTLGIPCGCWYHGLGTALLGWRVRYLLRCRYRLRGVSIRDFCIMCCIPAAAVEQQTIELAAHGLPPCIPPNWRHME